jgi:type IV pilus assembly protein PilQ
MNRLKRWTLPLVSITLGATIATCVVVYSAPPKPAAKVPTNVSPSMQELLHEAPEPKQAPAVVAPLPAQAVIDLPSPPLTQQAEPEADPIPPSPGEQETVAEAPDPPAPPPIPQELQSLLAPVLSGQAAAPAASQAAPAAAPAAEPPPPDNRIGISPVAGEGDDQLRVYIKDEDIRVVLAALSEQGGLNILPSKNVQGTVSAALNGVTVQTALEAILRSTGYVARREGAFIYVGTPLDFDAMNNVLDRIGTRIYRPNYVSAKELAALITPLLTPAPVGKAVATSPSKVDIPADNEKVGGDDFAGNDAVLVQDYEAILAAIDQIVDEIDQRPPQVAIEAMILSVRLNDTCRFGIDFRFLADKDHLRLATGQPMNDLAEVTFNGGLKFAFLDKSIGSFVDLLESVGDTNVIATPRLMVLNKHRADILIGSELGYVSTSTTETATTQSVNFLEVGAQLKLRPFISNDGMVRMEIHPELSTGNVRVEGGFTLPDKDVTQVTTNILVRDGYTVVIGGLMREDLTTTTSQVPVVGNLPLIGALFRSKTEEIEKREILVLVTPRIVHEPWMYHEGEQGAGEFHRRQMVYQDKMSPLGKRHLGRKYYRLAQEAWIKGERDKALKLVSLAIQFDPLNRAAIDLRADIWAGIQGNDHSGGTPIPSMPALQWLDGERIDPLILDELEQPDVGPVELLPPADRGLPALRREVVTPGAF